MNHNFANSISIAISLLITSISVAWSQESEEVIAQRLEVAIKYITPLAEAGEAEAQFHLGRLLRQPSKQKWDKSFEWLEAAVAQNHCGAILAVGELYFQGRKPIKRDRDKGMEFYQKGAELECTSSMVALGEAYRQGRGVKRNHEQANSWYLQAAELGDHRAAFYLGRQIANGRGAKKNWTEAYYWGSIAASGETENSRLVECNELVRRAVRRIDDEDIPDVEARIQAWKSEQTQKWEAFLAK